MSQTSQPTARDRISELLDQYRPDRYDPADKSWQEPVREMVAAEMDINEALSIAAARLVSTADANATKQTNKMLREIAETGEWPLDWMCCHAWPLAIDENERVAIRAATPDDFRRFASRERRAASLDFVSRNRSCEGALEVAGRMESLQIRFGRELQP